MFRVLILLIGGIISVLLVFIFCSLRLAKICDETQLK